MAFADDVIGLARTRLGENYVFGARADFTDPDYHGPWDCAEYATWVIYQASAGAVLLGCQPKNAESGDAYTGFWNDDATAYQLVVSLKDALDTKGYLLLRRPASGKIGHIAFSLGDGKRTVEAHSKNRGVIIGNADPDLRGWHYGIRLPTPDEWRAVLARKSRPRNWFLQERFGGMQDPRVPLVVDALNKKGFPVPKKTRIYSAKLTDAVAKFQKKRGILIDGIVGPETAEALGLKWSSDTIPQGTFNEKYGVFFGSLVKNGFFSSDPDDLSVRRSIRTNNPGALNISAWQKQLPGYVGFTQPDNSPNANKTTIYRTPEHGVAAWYILLADRYNFGSTGEFSIKTLARKYAGSGAPQSAVNSYVVGWRNASGQHFNGDSIVALSDTAEMLKLAKAMYFHESGKKTPLSDAQIKYGIETQRDGTMPA